MTIDFVILIKCTNGLASFYLTVFRSSGDDDYMKEMLEEAGSGDDEEEFDGKRKRKSPKKAPKRQKFSQVETEEIQYYFGEYLKCGICPRKKQVEDAKQKSLKKNGEIWKRSNDKIIKKISAMNHKKR